MLSVRVVGGLALEVDGAERAVPPGRPARLALAWLALHPGLHARSRVAGALWPDVREDSARASLRNALTAARRALGDDGARHLVATRDRVGLGPAEEVEVDVRRAAALAASGRYPEAAALLDGDLLPGLDADWVHDAREGHRAARAEVLAAEAAAAEAAGDAAEAIRATRALVALDPLAEASHRELIRRLTVAGDRAAARAAYDRLRDLLRDRLGVAPTRETRALLEAPTPPATDAGAGGGPGLPEPLRRRPRSPLVAREREQAALRRAGAEGAEGGPRGGGDGFAPRAWGRRRCPPASSAGRGRRAPQAGEGSPKGRSGRRKVAPRSRRSSAAQRTDSPRQAPAADPSRSSSRCARH
nr:BTAD domain-containing putative transcriptional regulator [Miltoncostaeaceae bacterium]